MPVPRTIPKTYVTWLAKLLSGDNACLFFVWFRSWHSVFRKVPQKHDFSEWNMRHTMHLHDLADKLEEQGCDVFLEGQNWFETRGEGSFDNQRQAGHHRAEPGRFGDDLRREDRTARVSDEIQVKLYMFLLPRSGHRRWQGVTFDGCVVYADGTEKTDRTPTR